jgi:bacterioferritin-associated ferredoxin
MSIDRCVCFNVTFSEMSAFVQQSRGGFDELQKRYGCGRGCAMCVPYIQEMLRTGQTEFPPDYRPPVIR